MLNSWAARNLYRTWGGDTHAVNGNRPAGGNVLFLDGHEETFPGLPPPRVGIAPLGRERNRPAKAEPDTRLNHPLGGVRLS